MSELFAEFHSLGLDALVQGDLFDEPAEPRKKKEAAAVREVAPLGERDCLFDKSYVCPVCGEKFKNKTVRAGKNRLVRIERDLRQVYTPVDQVKYDVVACPFCGYAALGRYFDGLSRSQVERVRSLVCAGYARQAWGEDHYTYEDARRRYGLALANAKAKMAKNSEKAYICLKLAWVLRGERDMLDKDAPDHEEMKQENETAEQECLQNALRGFTLARQREGYPMCGMDEPTTDYLLAALSFEVGDYATASKMVSTVLASHSANSTTKDKARFLKDEIIEAVKKQSGKA